MITLKRKRIAVIEMDNFREKVKTMTKAEKNALIKKYQIMIEVLSPLGIYQVKC